MAKSAIGTPPSDTAASTGPIEPPPRTRSPRRTTTVRRAACTGLRHGCSSYRLHRIAKSGAEQGAPRSAGCASQRHYRNDSLPAADPLPDKVMRFRSLGPARQQSGPRCRSNTIGARRRHVRGSQCRRKSSLVPVRSSSYSPHQCFVRLASATAFRQSARTSHCLYRSGSPSGVFCIPDATIWQAPSCP